ncbi:GH22917 [Drosophila grimshawi]|uniref:GH22917 n=1 Tax=Drosophila grimshawi TaxID=7222 RepID=B4JVU1_DROGR|nr:GH22917 [Drosophila grimshawi]
MKAKLTNQKRQQQIPLLAATLAALLLTVNVVAAAADSNYGASFISNPAIYAYTVANQQQQQQAENYINFDTAANVNGNLNVPSVNGNYRNFYYTATKIDQATPTANTSPAAAAAAAVASAPVAATQPAPLTGCTLDRLAVYKVILHTYWTRELFPKHYPDWRPTAQWTKTLGRTHNANYALYHIGQPATAGVKQFAETGKTDLLDSNAGEQQQQQMQAQKSNMVTGSGVGVGAGLAAGAATATMSERSVFDEFSLPAIQLGEGRSEAKVFVDSNHSLVSLMTRIVPSPDWFVGVDSFELCVGGSWIDTVTVELDPLDAGTDNGFTFTAPNWPTAPQGVIYRITSRYPAHPAGSFYYPKSKRLPPIATFQFIKLKEYELSEVFNIAEDDRKYETVQTQTHLDAEHNHVEMNNELSASIERERQRERERQEQQTPQQMQLQQFNDERQRIRSQLLAKMNPNYNNSQQPGAVNVVPKNDKHALMQSIANSYRRNDAAATAAANNYSSLSASSSASASASSASTRRRSPLGSKRRRDCRVSHWSEWTACSKSCGIGEMHRYRKVIKHGKRGGRPCPALQQSKWCGTERNCHGPQTYFNWSDSDT